MAFDKDGSGALDVNEFKIFLDEAGEEYDDEEIAEVYAVYDHDHDGALKFDEFVEYVKCIHDGDDTLILQHRFNAIDLNKNGSLDAEEIQKFQALCGNNLTLEEAQQLVKEMDTNGDGRVTLDEYIAYKTK
ncbi:EF hand family protein [Histomonas meleagridis]|uniref:EF hand family protein n=1 Tax=Histomonas meleagridis TaxID=135588 RepID=UPI003559504E|nr:EF hand family protein [Histomonas meleagridis]KAH0798516.1 EF hand family protein [Histomonas meleagridis]